MKVTLESTSKLVTVNGIRTRIWEGQTESGIRCHAFIVRIAAPLDQDQTQFQTELQETRAPSKELDAYPLRMIL